MNDKLYEILLKLPKKNLINLMWEALDNMQEYNGRSRTQCIVMAAGGTVDEEGKCSIGSSEEVRKNTNDMGPF